MSPMNRVIDVAARAAAPRPRLATRAAIVPLLAALAGCGSIGAANCPVGQDAAVQDLLYFGTESPSGHVGPDDWAGFLAESVSPRFPEGLTAWQASGQWRSAAGELVREPSYVLSLVRPPGAAADSAIRELVAEYKARFRQEAVLRVTSRVCMDL